MEPFLEKYIPRELTPAFDVPLVGDATCAKPVYMRVARTEEMTHVSLIDPQAHDLSASGRVFCKLLLFPNKSGFLDNLTAPSFSGKEVIGLVRKVMALSKTREMLFGDGSTILGCCEDGALTSLHGLEVFRKAKSWYMSQGASCVVDEGKMARCNAPMMENLYSELLTKKKKRPVPLDFDQFRHVTIVKWMRCWIDAPAYKAACTFLNALSVSELQESLLRLQERYPQLASVSRTLASVPSTITLGEALSQAVASRDESPEKHRLMHALRDQIVSKRDSAFLQYIVDDLKDKSPSPQKIAYALAALHNFLQAVGHTCKGIKYHTLLLGLLHGHGDDVREQIQMKAHPEMRGALLRFEDDGGRVCPTPLDVNFVQLIQEQYVKILEEGKTEPVPAKVLAHSTQDARNKWIEYRFDWGHSCIDAAEAAITYLSSLPLGMLDPELLQIGESLFDEKVMNACIKRSGQYLSKVAVNLFEGYAEKDVYPLFCLAKYLREEKGLFIFD